VPVGVQAGANCSRPAPHSHAPTQNPPQPAGRTRGLLPADFYALPEPVAAGFGPDALTLHDQRAGADQPGKGTVGTVLQARPQARFTAETDAEFYRRKKSSIAVRHVTGDRVVAMVEVLSPGNKASRHALRAFVDKACELLGHCIHLLIIDPFPPGPRDPSGVYAANWAEVQDNPFALPADKPLTLVAYECDRATRAFIEPVAVGDPLPHMPLFLVPNGCVKVPLEATCQTAFAVMPRNWHRVLEEQG
jgi:hypothetical protein